MSPYVVLARRWRPRSFSALVGQENVARALKNALSGGRIPHGFLFAGIRGVGKTTLARLLAMCFNCETGVTSDPCGQCGSCREIIAGNHPDVMEIDAASRTKVEQMRELLDLVGYAPSSSPYKVFILDEVHMLSEKSFNALLKTLEEPPSHVKFIFATTESRKIPATIVSRCQRYDLKRVSQEQLIAHMSHILEGEKVGFEESALKVVARVAEGSVRDALSLLDQSISHGGGEVKLAAVTELLGLSSREEGVVLLGHILTGNGPLVLSCAAEFYASGTEPEALVNDLLEMLHLAVREKVTGVRVDDDLTLGLDQKTSDISQEHIQMVYQVLLRGGQDLRLAENRRQALEMLLLRVTFLKPVPDLNRLIQGVKQSLAGGTVVSQGACAPVASNPSPVPVPKAIPSFSTRNDVARETLTSWNQLISSAEDLAPELAMKLKQQVACMDFHRADNGSAPTLVLQLVNDCFGPPERVANRVKDFLQTIGEGEASVVVQPASDQPRPETLGESAKRVKSDALLHLTNRTRENPLVQELSARFQAEILDVEPISSRTVQ
ncbi:MAG: DNA polymerase III subunit gamma/tau [Magnetococcales bacterium]|nr:DNA polymerase III subunit gamma/tau [Magnetococcales bacterium]